MKPGYATTEFWSTLLTHIISIAVLFNTNLNSDQLSALVPVGALLASGAAQAYYSHSRGIAKAANTVNVLTTPIGQDPGGV